MGPGHTITKVSNLLTSTELDMSIHEPTIGACPFCLFVCCKLLVWQLMH